MKLGFIHEYYLFCEQGPLILATTLCLNLPLHRLNYLKHLIPSFVCPSAVSWDRRLQVVTAQLNLNSTQLNLSWSDYIITLLPNPPHPSTTNFLGTSRQPRKLIFGMQPYFDPTRKTTSKKNGRRPKKNKKWKTT